MKVAIVHYHLGHGGVGAVIAAESEALSQANIPHVILVGASASGGVIQTAGPVREVRGLEYQKGPAGDGAGPLEERLRAAAADALGSAPDVWHFHNHSLGKIHLLPEVISRMAEANERMVLQIHDLAEDGRSTDYQNIHDPGRLYPVSSRIRYAFLNSRDLRIFTGAGLSGSRARMLENPIHPPPVPPPPVGDPLLFAPIRGIRRKNLGELVFLSAILPAGARIAISRAPLDPAALALHDKWAAFAGDRRLPIDFDVVGRQPASADGASDFESWVTRASHIVTTSVAEGFGLPALEAAAWRRPLIGREIPHLAGDLAVHDIRAGRTYQKLMIPLDWIGHNILREHIRSTLEANARLTRQAVSPGMENAVFNLLAEDGWLDFGNLPEPLQQGVIEQLSSPVNRPIPEVRSDGQRESAADWLARALENGEPTVEAEQLAPFSLDTYRKNLLKLLRSTASRSPGTTRFVDPDGIRGAFSGPCAFHFLRSAKPAPSGATATLPWRAVIFDIYGTLLIAPAGGIRPDPQADPVLRMLIRRFGRTPPDSPSTVLHDIIRRHHEQAGIPHPEIDLRSVWREMLSLPARADVTELVMEAEAAWHPSFPMPGAAACVRRLARSGVSLGILSNAQCNSLPSLGDIADLFSPEFCILSYRHLMAKPSAGLFQCLAESLASRGISPDETLFIGNDPVQDIAPASAHGFKTAWFKGHPKSLREGDCHPDITFTDWREIG